MTAATEPVRAEPSASVWEDFLDIFYAPRDVFARRSDGRFGLAMVVFIVLAAVLSYASSIALEPAYTGEIDRQLADAELTAEQLEGARGFTELMFKFGAIVMLPVMIVLTGLVLWLIGKLFDSQQTVKQGIMVATYANFPRLLGWLLMTIQGFTMDVSGMDRLYDAGFSAARFAPDGTSEFMLLLLSRLDLFTIWVTVLLGVGLSITGRIPMGRAMIAALIIWILGAFPALGQL